MENYPRHLRLLVLPLALSVSNCAAQFGKQQTLAIASKQAVNLPAPPSFLGPCKPSGVGVNDGPNIAFDAEHIAWKECSSQGSKSRAWYNNVRQRYSGK